MFIGLKWFETQQWLNTISVFLIASLFFIPISPSLQSIFIVLSTISILITSRYSCYLRFSLSQPCSKAAILLFLVVVSSCAWSPATVHTKLMFIGKYSKLLYLPILALGFQNRSTRLKGIYAFMLAMLISCIISIWRQNNDTGEVFHNHIVMSFMTACAAYFAGWLAIQQSNFLKRIPYLLAIIIYSYQLIFINIGRSGYLIYFVLMLLLMIQYVPLKKTLFAVLAFCFVFSLFSIQSTVFSERLHEIKENWEQYKNGNVDTPIGYRLMFHTISKSLFFRHPILGNGTAGFAYKFQKINTIDEWKHLLDPHSQYWLIAVDSGSVGLAALLIFFLSIFKLKFHLKEMKPIMLGILVAFLLGNLTDSLLFYSKVGFLFIMFSALCLGEYIEENNSRRLAIKNAPCEGPVICPTTN